MAIKKTNPKPWAQLVQEGLSEITGGDSVNFADLHVHPEKLSLQEVEALNPAHGTMLSLNIGGFLREVVVGFPIPNDEENLNFVRIVIKKK